jgi:uncharacterized coiled-coil DUF342 family protein
MNHTTEMMVFIFFYILTCGVFIWIIHTIEDDLGKGNNEYYHNVMREFDKIRALIGKLSYHQEKHDVMIEELRMTLDELIEKEKRLTFDSTDPGHHRELLKALTELKDIKDREKKLNEEIEEILQTGDL